MKIKNLVASLVIVAAFIGGAKELDAKPTVPYNYIKFFTSEGVHERHVFYIEDIYGQTWIYTFRLLNGLPEDPALEIFPPWHGGKIANDDSLNLNVHLELIENQLIFNSDKVKNIKIYSINGELLFDSKITIANTIDISKINEKLLIVRLENNGYFETFKIFKN